MVTFVQTQIPGLPIHDDSINRTSRLLHGAVRGPHLNFRPSLDARNVKKWNDEKEWNDGKEWKDVTFTSLEVAVATICVGLTPSTLQIFDDSAFLSECPSTQV